SVAFSPDGTRLVTGSEDSTVKLFEVATGLEALTLRGLTGQVRWVGFSPDGTLIAAGSSDDMVKIWDGRPWTPVAGIQREALGLLDFLFAKPLSKADVLEFLSRLPGIRPEARQLALGWADRYPEETDPERYHRAARRVTRVRYLNDFQYQFAL